MRNLAALSLGLTFSMLISVAAFAADTTSVTGHLRDGFCYSTMGAHGSSHKKCAMGCAKAGIPVLLVEDKTDKHYVVLPPKDDQPLPQSVVSKMEDEVTITGHQYDKGGISFLTADSVK